MVLAVGLGITSSFASATCGLYNLVENNGHYDQLVTVQNVSMIVEGDCDTSGAYWATSEWSEGYVQIKGETHRVLTSGGCAKQESFESVIQPNNVSYNGSISLNSFGVPKYSLAHVVFQHICLVPNSNGGLDQLSDDIYKVCVKPGV